MPLPLPPNLFTDFLAYASLRDHRHITFLCRDARKVSWTSLATNHGSATASAMAGSMILEALRIVTDPASGLDCSAALWRKVARTRLHYLMPIPDDDGCYDYEDFWHTIAAVATGGEVEMATLQEVQSAGEKFPWVLARAIWDECERSKKTGTVPAVRFITAWCRLAELFGATSTWLGDQEEDLEFGALACVAECKADPADLIEVVDILVRHGSLATGETIAAAGRRVEGTSLQSTRWKNLWCEVAKSVAVDLLKTELNDSCWYADECEILLAMDIGEPLFHDLQRVVARANMRREDDKWELQRERLRMTHEDEDEDRWHIKRECSDRTAMRRNDYDAERRRINRYNSMRMFFADIRRRPPRHYVICDGRCVPRARGPYE